MAFFREANHETLDGLKIDDAKLLKAQIMHGDDLKASIG